MNLLLMFEQIGRDIDFATFGIAIGIIAGIALLLGLLIILISRFCEVKEDPRISEIENLLAGANCGACGHPGCSGYAKALCEGKASLDDCGQTTKTAKVEISNILGQAVSGDLEPTIAVVACAGGNKCADKYAYQGYGDCISQDMLAGGRKSCETGCMGSGSCVDACPYLCIECYDGYAHVDPEQCRSCGLCIKTCPKGLIKRIPVSATVYVACSTNCRGKDVMNKCSAGCISCGICERSCPVGAIHLENNVPVIDYSKCTHCDTCLLKCPRKIIRHVSDNIKGKPTAAPAAPKQQPGQKPAEKQEPDWK
ncbi:MAG: RnfABCDGE type electron transport complex subunit B [Corallococcus sp.]|nr:RnfABCDGE type electron transport complex subunit B [Corallococcus sp.]